MTDASTLDDLEPAVDAIVARYRQPVIDGMRAAIDRAGVEHLRFARYHLGWQDADGRPTDAPAGKMLRPAIVLLCCEAVGGNVAVATPAAVAVELLHNFSLIHDDIEDRSDSRHGRPTLWAVAGIEQAINTGDGLFALAQRTLLDLPAAGVDPEGALRAATIFNDACIALCEGQYADISFESRTEVSLDEYEAMIAGKTASLIGAAAAIGALCGGAPDAVVEACRRWGTHLGLAFQVRDDVLGVWGDPALTGKPAADDVRARKKSFPVACAMQRLVGAERDEFARLYADRDDTGAAPRIVELLERSGARDVADETATRHAREARAALETLDLDPARRHELESLAAYVIHRLR